MIRINLANPKGMMGTSTAVGASGSDVSAPISEQSRKEGLVKLLVILMLPAALYFYEQTNIPTIRSELSRKQAKLAELAAFNQKAENAVSEIKKFKE
ncbi:MAG: fimbrial assembly protein, partial [Proteobacteria bacterium]